ncbi:MAG TPA: polysaccharide deacetylase family protein [Leptospiraceae bacterium]|nr:polysaccharide deacetylase family protein [Leptospiraceae bacterium]HMX34783.1 polysaccharide deacetylase family protein [Leptospiraceae bacterium]
MFYRFLKIYLLTLLFYIPAFAESAPNELGKFLIITYHVIGEKDSAYTRTIQGFKDDLALLKKGNYYPLKISDLEKRNLNIPKGKKPVFITLDDSSQSQFDMDEKGSISPNCAVGIMEDFKKKNPDFPLTATFFILPGAKHPNNLFGQEKLTSKKLEFLTKNNYEIQNHTLWHANLKKYKDKIGEQIVESQKLLNKYLPDYKMTSLAMPFGIYPPKDYESKLVSGSYKGIEYKHILVFDYSNRPSYSPYDKEFDSIHVRRVQAFKDNIEKMIEKYSESPDSYVSDGDPNTITFPRKLEDKLNLKFKEKLKVVTY